MVSTVMEISSYRIINTISQVSRTGGAPPLDQVRQLNRHVGYGLHNGGAVHVPPSIPGIQ